MAKDYPNRSDLRNPAAKLAATAATGQAYGEAGKQMAAQQAVPMGGPAMPTPQSSQPVNRPVPGSVVDLMAPTQRPQDQMAPIMNNRPTILPMSNPVIEELETLYRMYPNDDLAGLLSAIKYSGQ
jgi:hypothetical protein